MPLVSAKHALSPRELEFCKVLESTGGTNPFIAYVRAFCYRSGDAIIEPKLPVDGLDPVALREALRAEAEDPIRADEVKARAAKLLQEPHIQAFMKEMRLPILDIARSRIGEQALFGDDKDGRLAAKQILDDQDALGVRDAAEYWAQILCEIGTEVDVPLPVEVKHEHTCEQCGHQQLLTIPVDATTPLVEFFPSIKKRISDGDTIERQNQA